MRVLGIELRRSAALWTGLLVVLVGLGYFYGLPGPWGKGPDAWTEEWSMLAIWQRWLLNTLWPLALGAGAWQGRRDRRAKMDELLSTMPKSAFVRAMPAVVAMCVCATVAYLAIFLVGAIQVIGNASYHHIGWLPIMLVGILSMIAAVLFGMGIGRVLPYILTAPIVAVLAFVATTLALVGTPETKSALDSVISHQLATLTPVLDAKQDAFVLVATRVEVAQSLWFLGLTVTGFGLLTFVKRKALALIPAVVAVAIALPLLPSSRAELYEQDALAAALVCEDRVCVSRLHQDHLHEVIAPARQALDQLAKLPGGPTTVEEARTSPSTLMDGMPLSAGVAYFHFEDYEFRLNARRTILAGPLRQCAQDEELTQAIAKRSVVASWFDGELRPVASRGPHGPKVTELAEQMWQELRALPVDQQPARVASLRASAQEC
ncbi:hypothetical protein DMH04_15105 [Kibdelosporangium aridum]|uniref:Uncharacterized protein n=1 Tax=Kibdelosporangium aridum TaxID=2030 RepID=A0A428ZDE8_KIBAR|nr:hypothetical protein [Kibdelosporangium aridum]RSM86000.1 hypothetical protein DMH04_15105 [Kibdelosporangium aridum]